MNFPKLNRWLFGAVSWLFLGLLMACGNPAATTPPSQLTTTASQPTVTIGSEFNPQVTASTSSGLDQNSFKNPVFQADFPDPAILKVKDTYYAYATNAAGRNIQVAISKDLTNWELAGDALPALPGWAKLGGSLVWAPEVIAVGDKYLLYFTARDKQSNKQCIGVAVSDLPDARFKDSSPQPLVCQAEEGGSIDPNPYRDGSKLYLFWKNDGNCCSFPTYLYVRELNSDGLGFVAGSTPQRLVSNDVSWEGRVVEAPSMIQHGGNYYLFFSANDYAGFDYAIGYAICKSVTGPCQDAPENPILKSVMQKPLVVGPGHQFVLEIGDETWLFYHVWEVNSAGLKTSRRFMWLDRIIWKNGKPVIQGPTTEPQAAPKIKY